MSSERTAKTMVAKIGGEGVLIRLDRFEGLYDELFTMLERHGLQDGPIPTAIIMGPESLLNVEFEHTQALLNMMFNILNEMAQNGNYVAHIKPSIKTNGGVLAIIGVQIPQDSISSKPQIGRC